jgi:hypothetical protein
MGTVAKPTRENRTITVDFRDEATYFRLIKDGKAFVEFVLAFLLSLGFQLTDRCMQNLTFGFNARASSASLFGENLTDFSVRHPKRPSKRASG